MRHNRDGFDVFFKVFPYIFMVIFGIALLVIVAQFAVMGWLAFTVISDPTGSADAAGELLGKIVAPVADAVQGK